MRHPRVPDMLIGGFASLPELFRASTKWRKLTRNEVEEIIRLVPAPITEQVCFLDRLTGIWRYDYGEPFDGFKGGQIVLGTTMFNDVDRLFEVIDCARSRLGAEQLVNYLRRLKDPSKHQDALFEFAPILRVDPTTRVDYEVTGHGEGNSTIDWLIRNQRGSLLLEVKNRTKDFVESIERVHLGERDPDGSAPAPTHDPALLFRSVEPKFRRRNSSEVTQAVWIVTVLKQEESELRAAFAKLDAQRVHAAILGDFEDDVYVVANHPVAKERVCQFLQVRESRRAVFQRGAKTASGQMAASAGHLSTNSSTWAIWFADTARPK